MLNTENDTEQNLSCASETIPSPTAVVKHPGFQPGTGTRVPGSGRKPGTLNRMETAVGVANRLGFNVIEAMIDLIQNGRIMLKDGRMLALEGPDIVRALKDLAPYLHSKAPTAILQKHDHTHKHVDITRIMMDPALAEAAETLALAMAARPDGENIVDAEFEDILPNE